MTMHIINAIQKRLKRRKIDALLVSQPDNRFYLSNFSARDHSISESSGYLLIPKSGTPLLLTDFRYQIQAEQEAGFFDVLIYKRGLFKILERLLPSLGIHTLAFEAHYFLFNQAEKLRHICQKHLVNLLPTSNLVERMRLIKTSHEIDLIKRSVQLNEHVFQEVYPSICANDTEIDVALRLENAMRAQGSEGPSFDTIVATGPNGAKPHAVPSRTKIIPGVPLIIDMGLILAGYCSDMTRSIVLGSPTPKTINIFRIVRKAQLAGMESIKAGAICKDVDSAARSIISDAGFGACFGHSLGHGVGVAVHEEPRLGPRCHKKLQSDMIVTVEPGIYIPDWGGVRLENMVLVTRNGHQNFNKNLTFLDI